MSLSREQYDKLMREYSRRRDDHRRALLRRRREVYAKIPRYRELDEQIPDLSLQELNVRLGGQTSSAESTFSAQLAGIEAEKAALLAQAGFPADYLEMTYDCPICRDTGYSDGVKCACLRRQEVHILYQQSRLDSLLKANRFELLDRSYYQGEDLEHFESALGSCRSFIAQFDDRYDNLFFYGTVGTGKSFLSICTAGELLSSGHSVLYFSAVSLFDRISSYLCQPGARSQYHAFQQDLQTCDLLVIDDLGTESGGSFTASQLFGLLTERDLLQKSTIISTNLSLPELRDRYSDRIFSRITSNFTVRKLTGPDIRIEKKIKERDLRHGNQQTS